MENGFLISDILEIQSLRVLGRAVVAARVWRRAAGGRAGVALSAGRAGGRATRHAPMIHHVAPRVTPPCSFKPPQTIKRNLVA